MVAELRRRRRPTSALSKLLIGLCVAILCVVVATQLLMQYSVGRFAQQTLEAELSRDARLVRDLLSREEMLADPDARQRELSRIASQLDVRISIIDPADRVIADSHLPVDRLVALEPSATRELADARAHGFGVAQRHSDVFDDELFFVAVPMDPARPDGELLRLSVWASHLELSSASMRETLYWIASGTVLGALVFSMLLASWLTRPLRRFGQTVRAMSRGEVGPAALKETAVAGELHDLAQAFVDLTSQLDAARHRVRSDSPHLNALLEALDVPVVFVNPVGQIVRTNEAARARLELLYTMRDLEEANLSELRVPLREALDAGAPLCTVLDRGRDSDEAEEEEAAAHGEPPTPPERLQATIFPMNAPGRAQGAVIILTPTPQVPRLEPAPAAPAPVAAVPG